jgi:hypothetical protein
MLTTEKDIFIKNDPVKNRKRSGPNWTGTRDRKRSDNRPGKSQIIQEPKTSPRNRSIE